MDKNLGKVLLLPPLENFWCGKTVVTTPPSKIFRKNTCYYPPLENSWENCCHYPPSKSFPLESVTYFRGGGPSFVTVCDRGEGGVKMVKNSVTYFMDGPLELLSSHGYVMPPLFGGDLPL